MNNRWTSAATILLFITSNLAFDLPSDTPNANLTVFHYHHSTTLTSLAKRSNSRVLNPCSGPRTSGTEVIISQCLPHISPQAITVVCGEDGHVNEIDDLDGYQSSGTPASCTKDEICIDLPLTSAPFEQDHSLAYCVAHSAFSSLSPLTSSHPSPLPESPLTTEVSLPLHSLDSSPRYAQARLIARFTPIPIKAASLELASFASIPLTGGSTVQRINGREACKECFEVGLGLMQRRAGHRGTDLLKARVIAGKEFGGLGGGALYLITV